MSRIIALVLLMTAGLFASGCVTASKSTTPRTAVEQALLSESMSDVVKQFDNEGIAGKKFFLEASDYASYDKEFALSEFRLKMLQSGMTLVEKREEADVVVFPRSAVVGIDEDEILIGIPSLTIPMMSAINTPELALFKKSNQVGRVKLALFGVNRASGDLAFDNEPISINHYYKRYKILFFITWDRTDLTAPFETSFAGTPKGVKNI